MAKVITRVVPCAQCDFWTAFYRDAGMKVLGCRGLAGSIECEISMVDPLLADAPAAAAADSVPLPRGGAAGGLAASIAAPRAASEPAAAAAAAPLTPTQVRTAQALVNLFETGSVRGDYGQVTLLPGDPGHLTFGRSQTTLASGNLALLIEQYVGNAAAVFGRRLGAWLPRLRAGDLSLDDDEVLHNLLRASADDPVMRETQDAFFDSAYWQPALRRATRHGLVLPLSVAVVYDSTVHGSWAPLRKQVDDRIGPPQAAGETRWVAAYLAARESWLAQHPHPLLRKTTYRTAALRRLVELGAWGLELPLVVRGSEISPATLDALPPGCYAGPQPGTRALALQEPLLRGLDVRRVQLGLSLRGVAVRADGIFGRGSRDRVLEFQAEHGLPMTGALDAAVVSELARL